MGLASHFRGLIAASVVAVVVCGVPAAQAQQPPAPPASAAPAELLDRLLAEGRGPELLSALEGSIERSVPWATDPASDQDAAAIGWLRRNAGRIAALDTAPPLLLLFLVRFAGDADIVERMTWLQLWRLRIRYDFARCTSPFAGEGSGHAELLAAEVAVRLDSGGEAALEAVDRALAADAAVPSRGAPGETCRATLSVAELIRRGAEGVEQPVKPESEWPAAYRQARRDVRARRDELAASVGPVERVQGAVIEHRRDRPGHVHLHRAMRHDQPVVAAAWSADSRVVATGATPPLGRAAQTTVWSVADGMARHRWESATVNAVPGRWPVAFVRGGSVVATIASPQAFGAGRPVAFRNAASGDDAGAVALPEVDGSTAIGAIESSADGRWLAVELVRNGRCAVAISDATTLATHARISNENGPGAWGLRFFSADPRLVLFHPADDDIGIVVMDRARVSEVSALRGALGGQRSLGRALAIGRDLIAFSTVSGVSGSPSRPVVSDAPSCTLDSDDPAIRPFVQDVPSIIAYDWRANTPAWSIDAAGTAIAIDWSRDGRFLAATFDGDAAAIWDLRAPPLPRPRVNRPAVSTQRDALARIRATAVGARQGCVRFSPDSRRLALCNGNDLLVFDLPQD